MIFEQLVHELIATINYPLQTMHILSESLNVFDNYRVSAKILKVVNKRVGYILRNNRHPYHIGRYPSIIT